MDKKYQLTPRQQKFADFFIQLGNETQAAINAGYSQKSARTSGSRNMQNANILQYIKEFGQDDDNIATAEEVLRGLTSIARGIATEEIAMFDPFGQLKTINKKVAAREQVKAWELLGKRYRLFVDKVDISGNVPIRIIDDIGDMDNEID